MWTRGRVRMTTLESAYHHLRCAERDINALKPDLGGQERIDEAALYLKEARRHVVDAQWMLDAAYPKAGQEEPD